MLFRSPNRRNRALLVTAFFLLSTVALFGLYIGDLDSRARMTDKFRADNSSVYDGFNYSLSNQENEEIKPRFYAVGPRQRGQVRMFSGEEKVRAGERAEIRAMIDERRDKIPPAGNYQLIIKDMNSGEYYSKIISMSDYLDERNPRFIRARGFRFHWTGSIYGKGDYKLETEKKGLNASFSDCSSGCGFNYRDDYETTEMIRVRGEAYLKGNENSLYVSIDDKRLDVPLDNSTGYQRFSREVNISRDLDLNQRGEVEYEIGFRTKEEEFQWVQVNEYMFYEP